MFIFSSNSRAEPVERRQLPKEIPDICDRVVTGECICMNHSSLQFEFGRFFYAVTLLLMAVLAFAHTSVNAQVFSVDSITHKYTYSKVVTFENYKSELLYKKAITYCKTGEDKFYKYSGTTDVFFGTDSRGDYHINNELQRKAGYEAEDKDTKTITCNVVMQYTGGFGSCIALMVINAALSVQFKDGRSRIKITDFRYTNYLKANMGKLPIAGGDDEAPCRASGSLEDLVQCKRCHGAIDRVTTFINTASNDIIKEYETFISTSNIAADTDKW